MNFDAAVSPRTRVISPQAAEILEFCEMGNESGRRGLMTCRHDMCDPPIRRLPDYVARACATARYFAEVYAEIRICRKTIASIAESSIDYKSFVFASVAQW